MQYMIDEAQVNGLVHERNEMHRVLVRSHKIMEQIARWTNGAVLVVDTPWLHDLDIALDDVRAVLEQAK